LPTVAKEFIKYVFVGGFATVVDIMVFWVLRRVGINLIISNVCSFTAGITVNYLLSVRFIFEKSSVKNKKVEFIIFCVIGVIGLFVNTSVIWVLYQQLNVMDMIAKVIATGVSFVWNFLARKFIIYR